MENSDETKNRQQELKHLGFVRAATINTIVWLTSVYGYAKINSGPLRSAVGTVETAVTTVVTPVFSKFKDVPDQVLVFLDQKVYLFLVCLCFLCGFDLKSCVHFLWVT